jgi:HAD superfamily hydrolase (TIGR01509 family)
VSETLSITARQGGLAVAARAVVWDMDGTLLDSSVAVPAAFAATLARRGGPEIDAAQVIAAYPLGTAEVIMAHLAGRPVTAADMDEYYGELRRSAVAAYPGVAEVLGGLRARGHPVAVFTGASRRAAGILLAAAGLAADVLIGGDQVRNPKPAADGLLLAAQEIGVCPADLAYVGDSPADMGAARAAGSHAAAAAWGHMYDAAVGADSVLTEPGQALSLLG